MDRLTFFRTIEEIDRDIDANRAAMIFGRLHCLPESAREWQNAWNRCPDHHAREHELFCERYEAQQKRNARAESEYRTAQRRERAARNFLGSLRQIGLEAA